MSDADDDASLTCYSTNRWRTINKLTYNLMAASLPLFLSPSSMNRFFLSTMTSTFQFDRNRPRKRKYPSNYDAKCYFYWHIHFIETEYTVFDSFLETIKLFPPFWIFFCPVADDEKIMKKSKYFSLKWGVFDGLNCLHLKFHVKSLRCSFFTTKYNYR